MSEGGGGGGGGWNPPAGSKRKTRTPHSDVGKNIWIQVPTPIACIHWSFVRVFVCCNPPESIHVGKCPMALIISIYLVFKQITSVLSAFLAEIEGLPPLGVHVLKNVGSYF